MPLGVRTLSKSTSNSSPTRIGSQFGQCTVERDARLFRMDGRIDAHVDRFADLFGKLFELVFVPELDLRRDVGRSGDVHVFAGSSGMRLDLAEGRDRDRLGRHDGAQVRCTSDTRRAAGRPKSLPTRLRVNSSKPNGRERLDGRTRAIFRKPASSVAMTLLRLPSVFMSMKSHTIMPPMSRNRTWRAISAAASTLVRDDRIFEIFTAGELPGVHVDHGQRFGRLDDDRSAGGQFYRRPHQAPEFLIDFVIAEQRPAAGIRFDPLQILRAQQAQ